MRVSLVLMACWLRGMGSKHWVEELLLCVRGSCVIPLAPTKPGGGMMLTGVLVDGKILLAPEQGGLCLSSRRLHTV